MFISFIQSDPTNSGVSDSSSASGTGGSVAGVFSEILRSMTTVTTTVVEEVSPHTPLPEDSETVEEVEATEEAENSDSEASEVKMESTPETEYIPEMLVEEMVAEALIETPEVTAVIPEISVDSISVVESELEDPAPEAPLVVNTEADLQTESTIEATEVVTTVSVPPPVQHESDEVSPDSTDDSKPEAVSISANLQPPPHPEASTVSVESESVEASPVLVESKAVEESTVIPTPTLEVETELPQPIMSMESTVSLTPQPEATEETVLQVTGTPFVPETHDETNVSVLYQGNEAHAADPVSAPVPENNGVAPKTVTTSPTVDENVVAKQQVLSSEEEAIVKDPVQPTKAVLTSETNRPAPDVAPKPLGTTVSESVVTENVQPNSVSVEEGPASQVVSATPPEEPQVVTAMARVAPTETTESTLTASIPSGDTSETPAPTPKTSETPSKAEAVSTVMRVISEAASPSVSETSTSPPQVEVSHPARSPEHNPTVATLQNTNTAVDAVEVAETEVTAPTDRLARVIAELSDVRRNRRPLPRFDSKPGEQPVSPAPSTASIETASIAEEVRVRTETPENDFPRVTPTAPASPPDEVVTDEVELPTVQPATSNTASDSQTHRSTSVIAPVTPDMEVPREVRPPEVPHLDSVRVEPVQGTRATESSSAPRAEAGTAKTVPDTSTLANLGGNAVKSVRYMLSRDVPSMTVRLVPESLGEVRFEVRSDGDNIRIRVESANPSVRETMERHMPMLRQALSQEGFDVSRIDVTPRLTSGSEFGNHHAGGRSNGEAAPSNTGRGTATPDHHAGGETSRRQYRPPSHAGNLDLFA